jgi:hypothetical protein
VAYFGARLALLGGTLPVNRFNRVPLFLVVTRQEF